MNSKKRHSLKDRGCLHKRASQVADPLFEGDPFFDPQDLVQVKYEMLRRVRSDGDSVSHSAATFGFSRPSFYEAKERFEREGLPGLLPKRPGPRGGHKLTEEVVDFLEEIQGRPGSSPSSSDLAQQIRKKLGLEVHPRSVERALERRRKKNGSRGGTPDRG